jgi:hypothetical protein
MLEIGEFYERRARSEQHPHAMLQCKIIIGIGQIAA